MPSPQSSPSGRGRRDAAGEGKVCRAFIVSIVIGSVSILSETRAEIPWPEVAQRLAYENERLARRAGGHAGEYFFVGTLYYALKESGFTFESGFDATRSTRPGLHGHTYPRDFLRAVMKEGYGRITVSVNGRNYIRYNGGSYGFAGPPSGGGGTLVARSSAAARLSGPSRRGLILETPAPEIQSVFRSTRWRVMDTGGGLHRWQLDCYYGEDEPLGSGRLMARPRSTTFEYAYSTARVSK